MAWFDPPLHKPGNKRCPNCGKGQLRHLLTGPFWSNWRCRGCQSILGFDHGRQQLAYLIWAAICLGNTLWIVVPDHWRWVALLFIPAVIAVLVFRVCWVDSVKLERTPEANPQAWLDGPPARSLLSMVSLHSRLHLVASDIDTPGGPGAIID